MNASKSLGLGAIIAFALSGCASNDSASLFSSPECGIQFLVPAKQMVTRIAPTEMMSTRCALVVGLLGGPESHAMIIDVFGASFASVAHDNGFITIAESREDYGEQFTGNNDDWLIVGRQGSASHADFQLVNGLKVISGIAAVGRPLDGGGMAMGEETRAVAELLPGTVAVVSGGFREDVFRLLSSLRSSGTKRPASLD